MFNRRIQKSRFISKIGLIYSDINIIEQYERAINTLVNNLICNKQHIDSIAYPVLYLMRHSIELSLKENIIFLKKYSMLSSKKIKNHSLIELFRELERHYYKSSKNLNFFQEVNDEYFSYKEKLEQLILSLGDCSSSFRYTHTLEGRKIFNNSESIDITFLKDNFDSSMIFLTNLANVISPYTDYADYIKFDKSIELKSYGIVNFCLPIYSIN